MSYELISPIYIDIELKKYCSDCPRSDLELESNTLTLNFDEHIKNYTLKCNRREICKHLSHMFEDKNETD